MLACAPGSTLPILKAGETWGLRDWIDVLGVAATVVAAYLAMYAIQQTRNQASENNRALIRERQIEFWLNQLSSLARLLPNGSSFGTSDAQIRLIARTLPVDLIPHTRAAFDLPTTPAGIRWWLEHCAQYAVHSDKIDRARGFLSSEVAAATDLVLAGWAPPLERVAELEREREKDRASGVRRGVRRWLPWLE